MARSGVEQHEAETCQTSYVPGRARNVHVNVLIESLAGEPVLLPVWVMAYRYQDRVYRFLVNGQTGRATGTAPQSLVKIGLVAVAVVVAALAALALAGGLLGR